MSMQRTRVLLGMSAIAALALLPGMCWAIFYGLGPDKDEWGLRYNVEVVESESNPEMLTVRFTLINEGRLKPIHSVGLSALQKENVSQGTKTFEKLGPFAFKVNASGKRVAEKQIRKDQAQNAVMQVLTQRVDGKHQSQGAAYYDIPLKKFLENGSGDAAVPLASPPSVKTTK